MKIPKLKLSIALFVVGASTLALLVLAANHHEISAHKHQLAESVGNVLKYGWTLFIIYFFAKVLRVTPVRETVKLAKKITIPSILQNVLVLIAVVAISLCLYRWVPILNFSWLYLLPANTSSGGPTNIVMIPLQIRYVGIGFVLLFALCVPTLARREEIVYRLGTRNWRDGSIRSVKFGLAHCLMGVPLCVGVALCVSGLWYTLQYFRGGIERSTLHHSIYNWIIVCGALVWTIVQVLH